MSVLILGIESSCDETSAAVSYGNKILANIIANQKVHEKYGGVVPELASRAHQQNIIPVVELALREAGVKKTEIQALAFTRGPGLLGSLLVGVSFVKAFSLARKIPMIEVNHLHAHVLCHFAYKDEKEKQNQPEFPYLCLLISGGHTMIILVKDYYDFEILGGTIDDAAGEAFDKIAKILGLPYPGGPLIDKLAQQGNPEKFTFPHPRVSDFDYSFSGLKTSVLYFIRDNLKIDPDFIQKNKEDIAASVQKTIVDILYSKLITVAEKKRIKRIAIAGGVSANSLVRSELIRLSKIYDWKIYIPPFEYCTDNAAMVAVAGYYRYLIKDFARQDVVPYARSL